MDQQGILLWPERFLQVRDTIIIDNADTPDLRLAPPEPADRLLPATLKEKEQRIWLGVVTRPRVRRQQHDRRCFVSGSGGPRAGIDLRGCQAGCTGGSSARSEARITKRHKL